MPVAPTHLSASALPQLSEPSAKQPNLYPYSPEELEAKEKMYRIAGVVSLMMCVCLMAAAIVVAWTLPPAFIGLGVGAILLKSHLITLWSGGVICSGASLFFIYKSSVKKHFDDQAIEEYRNLAKTPSDGAIRYLRRSRRAIQQLLLEKPFTADWDFYRRSESGETLLGLGILPECAKAWIQAGADGNVPWDKLGGESFWELQDRACVPMGDSLPLLQTIAEEPPSSSKEPPLWPQQVAAWETSVPLPPGPPSRWPELLAAINRPLA